MCIQVKKVYDACIQQERLENITVCICQIQPNTARPIGPFEFVSCRSSSNRGKLKDLIITRLPEREHFARVRATVEIPIDIVFTDQQNEEHVGKGFICVHKDVILFVPNESIIPFFVDNIVSAICVTGTFAGDSCFNITVCVTIILKIVAEVDLLIPAFGFCRIPPCEEFAENICDEFFALPIFPPQLEDSRIGAGGSHCHR
ncbi:MAG: hypothetical protein ACOX7W_01810 [Christensenellales bacterium]